MRSCKICGSYAINSHLHDRILGKDLDLCDVCYWQARAMETLKREKELQKEICELLEACGTGNPYDEPQTKEQIAKQRDWKCFETEGAE